MRNASLQRARSHEAWRTAAPLMAVAALMAAVPALGSSEAPGSQNPVAASYAEPPAGLLTPWEEQRHKIFVENARAGDVELVFIGDSATEFWLAEGRGEWDKNFARLKAANFGVQGADTQSVLWRLQNGELDGFTAEVVVLDALLGSGDFQGASEAEILAGNSAIVAEIRKRQPNARILLLVVPRLRANSLQGALRAHFANLADGSTIRFLDVTRSFVAPTGGFDTSMGSGRGTALSEKGYAALAQAMRSTLTELMREG